MDKSAIDTPSREIDLGNIPVHLRTALRRALEFEARAPAPSSAEEAEQCEEQLRAIADEFFGALLTPVLQRAVRSAAVGDAASALVRHLPRRMRSDGLETVNVRTSRGTTVPVTTPYYREKHARGAKRRPGLYPALVVLGIYDRCTPKLASDASRAVAMLSSLAEAQAQLRSDGIALDIKTLRSTAYRYAARARAAQQSAACGLLDRVTGKRVVVSLDGGRVRVRRKKRGPKTKKGRNRFHTDWKEPKLLILYVVGDDGRPSQTWAPIIDGTLRGPEAVFALLLSYARQIGLNAADKVLFIADGAPWIWQRLQRLIAALGLSPTQVLGLIDPTTAPPGGPRHHARLAAVRHPSASGLARYPTCPPPGGVPTGRSTTAGLPAGSARPRGTTTACTAPTRPRNRPSRARASPVDGYSADSTPPRLRSPRSAGSSCSTPRG